jgi:Domain of unknown function (DUF4105)
MKHAFHTVSKILKRIFLYTSALCGVVVLIGAIILALRSPSNDRNWETEQQKIAYASVDGSTVTIHNLRYFTYPKGEPTQVRYEDRTIDVNEIESVDFVVSYFSESDKVAHTFLTFTVKDQPGISISIEARREKGEKYSPLKGLFRKYELMYVVGDERDIIALRTHVRNERLYLYPTIATEAVAQQIFVTMIDRLNTLHTSPAFYNTITHNCTNLLARHVEAATDTNIPFSYKMLLPGYADELVYDLGLLQTDLPFAEFKAKSRINPGSIEISDPEFSQKIRGGKAREL